MFKNISYFEGGSFYMSPQKRSIWKSICLKRELSMYKQKATEICDGDINMYSTDKVEIGMFPIEIIKLT